MNSVMRIYIDDGSTNIKLAWKDEGKVKRAISPNSFKPEWSFNLGDNKVANYEVEGEKFSFDPTSADAVVTTETRYQYSLVNVVAIHHALHQTDISPQDVEIIVTLPLSEYLNSDYQPNLENINRKKASVSRAVTLQGGKGFTVRKVSVLPESIPAGFSVLANIEEDDSLLIVDLGGTTLDVSHVRGKMSGITRTYGDAKVGVSLITNAIRDTLAGNTRISALHADNIIINREKADFLQRRLHDDNLREAVVNAISARADVLKNRVTAALERFTGYTHVMCVGGGTELIADAVRKATKMPEDRFFTSVDPQFDLVLGMLEMKEEAVNA